MSHHIKNLISLVLEEVKGTKRHLNSTKTVLGIVDGQNSCEPVDITWNPNDPCIDWKRPSLLKPKNRGQTGSRYINH